MPYKNVRAREDPRKSQGVASLLQTTHSSSHAWATVLVILAITATLQRCSALCQFPRLTMCPTTQLCRAIASCTGKMEPLPYTGRTSQFFRMSFKRVLKSPTQLWKGDHEDEFRTAFRIEAQILERLGHHSRIVPFVRAIHNL